jgi:hypothetical protein
LHLVDLPGANLPSLYPRATITLRLVEHHLHSTIKHDIIDIEDESTHASTATFLATWSKSRLPWEVMRHPLHHNDNV